MNITLTKNTIKLKPGIRYIVTKQSDDGTFMPDDLIKLNSDGSISIINEQAFIPADELGDGLAGVGVKVDVEWVKQKLIKAKENYTAILDTLVELQIDLSLVNYWREVIELYTSALQGLIDRENGV